MKFGLVTYLWGQHMDLPTVISACEKSGLTGVELRTEHKHGVEPLLNKTQRDEVRKRFVDSSVTLVGYGSNAEFHSNDAEKVKANIELTKRYVQLMADCGGSGARDDRAPARRSHASRAPSQVRPRQCLGTT